MKCVCPMGGNRTCPDDCPLAVWASLSPVDRKAQRKPVAKMLYKQNFTMDQIATQLGVSHMTIARDLSDFNIVLKSKPAKTASNPKGAGRPKGSTSSKQRRKNTTPAARAAAREIVDGNKTYPEVERETGFSNIVLRAAVAREEGRREEREAQPLITPDMLSMSAQEKLDVAVRQHKRKLDSEFHQRVNERVREFIDATILPDWKQKIDVAHKLYDKRKALMDKDTFNAIRRGLHPDSRHSISDKKLGEAFDAFMALEKYLINEQDSPTPFGADMPRTYADWEEAKRRATEARRARRTVNSVRPR